MYVAPSKWTSVVQSLIFDGAELMIAGCFTDLIDCTVRNDSTVL